jgi:hypothetical protein
MPANLIGGLHEQVCRFGFATIPTAVPNSEITALLGELKTDGLSRSRAGFRHAMRHHAVAAFARDSRLVSLAAEILAQLPSHSAPRFSTNRQHQTGW